MDTACREKIHRLVWEENKKKQTGTRKNTSGEADWLSWLAEKVLQEVGRLARDKTLFEKLTGWITGRLAFQKMVQTGGMRVTRGWRVCLTGKLTGCLSSRRTRKTRWIYLTLWNGVEFLFAGKDNRKKKVYFKQYYRKINKYNITRI